ncbi:uncharacterized protein [Rutidosis leptorrhynchoides]|uniref:uncharacterized protein n=1 Tax=Rutidosis leptorrhynchoides TaxID=125765 RepID=UPI003A9A5787
MENHPKPRLSTVQVLKAKYFPFSTFLEANLGNNPSLVWRSILYGRETLLKGSIWRIANSDSIRIREDNWLHNFNLSSRHFEALQERGIRRISQLLEEGRTWNLPLLRSILGNHLAYRISLVPIRATGSDLFAWSGSKDNVFSVRSAYFVALEGLQQNTVRNPFPLFWNLIWKLDVPPKIKLFLWRVGHQSLATRDNLGKRGITCVLEYPVCGSARKNQAHLNKAWKELISNLLCATVLAARNCIIDLIQVSSQQNQFGHRQSSNRHWILPPESTFKLNCDAAVYAHLDKWGLGSVIRDHNASVICCQYSLQDGIPDIPLAEAATILQGISAALSAGFERLIIESDSLLIVNELNRSGTCFLSCHDIICKVKQLARNFVSCIFAYTPRSNNRLAHSLANLRSNGNGRLPSSLYSIALLYR